MIVYNINDRVKANCLLQLQHVLLYTDNANTLYVAAILFFHSTLQREALPCLPSEVINGCKRYRKRIPHLSVVCRLSKHDVFKFASSFPSCSFTFSRVIPTIFSFKNQQKPELLPDLVAFILLTEKRE